MTKKQKQQDKLFKIPPPTDFTWDELLPVMQRYGFKEKCEGGSHYIFTHNSGFNVVIAKSHPNGILKRYQIKDAKEAINTVLQGTMDNKT